MKGLRPKNIENIKTAFGVILVGISAGMVSYFFHHLISIFSRLSLKGNGPILIGGLISLVLVLGSHYLSRFVFPETSGSGIPYVKLALVALKGKMSKRMPLGKFLTGVLSLSSGLSMGREGPMVTISASLAHLYGKILGLSRESTKLLVIAGASSGLSGAFNTPIAAVVFTIEEVLGEINSRYMGAIIMASVIASTTAFNILGAVPLFKGLSFSHEEEWHLIFYGLLGLLMPFLAEGWKLFLMSLKKIKTDIFQEKEVLYIFLVFLCLVFFSLLRPDLLGDGHSIITRIFDEGTNLGIAAFGILLVGKFFISGISYSSGLSGGLFLPVLCLGALGGGLYAEILTRLGVQGLETGAYALLGMTSLLVAVIRVPFTAFVMLFELTRDYDMILPLMVSSATSYIISQLLSEESIYESLAEFEGIHLPGQKDRETLSEMDVGCCMITDVICVNAHERVSESKKRLDGLNIGGIPVLKNGDLAGIVSISEVANASNDFVIWDICRKDIITVHPDQSLLVAVEKLQRFKVGRLPVVSRYNKKKVVGIITLEDIFKYFESSKLSATKNFYEE